MSGGQILALLALSVFAIYRQSVRHRVSGPGRFKLALIYAVAGIAAGGFYLPPDALSWVALGVSLLASIVVGIARGRLTRVYRAPDGAVYSQGTPLTIVLFLLLIAAKFGWGAWAYFHQAHPHGGFGEVLLMIAAMVAMQAEIVWRRSLRVGQGSGAHTSPEAAAPG